MVSREGATRFVVGVLAVQRSVFENAVDGLPGVGGSSCTCINFHIVSNKPLKQTNSKHLQGVRYASFDYHIGK